MPKQYSKSVDYEKKLSTVMEKLGVEKYDYNWTRKDCYIEFYYKNQLYRFENSLDKAKKTGQKIIYVSDCFAQLVLALEDLARIVSRGIYDLSAWISGMKALPQPKNIPHYFLLLGFTDIPTEDEVKAAYRKFAAIYHPDAGGSSEEFQKYSSAKDECLRYLNKNTDNEIQ